MVRSTERACDLPAGVEASTFAGMRVGIVTTSYPRWRGDAAGSFVAGHAAYLRGTGATVEIVAAGAPDVDPAWDAAEGVRRVAAPPGLFYAGGAPEAIGRGVGGAAGFAARLGAAVVARASRWDAVAAHWLAPSAWAAVPTRGPLLAIAHGGDVHLLAARGLLRSTLRALAVRGARLACVAAPLRDAVIAARPASSSATIVQPMGVDGATIAAVVAARAVRPAQPHLTIAVLARLVPIKGVDVALWALASLPPRFRMVVAGDGPERARLMTLARELGVEARVAWRGWLDAPARDRVLVDADVVAVPSIVTPDGRHEGTPLAALEALACGVPVVATATGGLAALDSVGARVVPPRDPRALAAAIARAATLPLAPVSALAWPAVGARLDEHWRRQVRS